MRLGRTASPAYGAAHITGLGARLVLVPLSRPWGPDVPRVHVIATTVSLSDGTEGHGFSWTPTIGAEAVLALLKHDIAGAALGRTADPEAVWQPLWEYLHEAGGGGLTTIALAGLDLALWDAAARRAGLPLTGLLGLTRESVEVYGSGVNLHYSLDELRAQAERWVAAGFDAVKVKVGKPDLGEDVERVAAVRDVLGPTRRLMIDANQRWDLDRATRAVTALSAFAPAWVEEPLRADDLAAHAELARRVAVPVAVGENLHTEYRFADFLRAGAARVVQPNIVRVGGITPFLRIVRLAREHGAALHPHLLPELSGQLALTLGADVMVEEVEDAGFGALGVLRDPSPVHVAGGRLTETDHAGLGLRFADPGEDTPATAPQALAP
ncbi:mandelate racemase/muconate lactonizing enzyme family protein [Streptomyces johnsoniae]|uniref:Mandelate racemase/muconate lactonizing enzyme family protein n=1 Tax=Streptomyces johnsoniae TaxID=3075532 RepID=A0ABU2SCB7_9ACTN|nr:mandelate racemase/muconate lactonizing enzyme family protein [Streptomyces sp. DSM 41886]MDT0446542.1 mandelate racemase/muconate lactonizing enzyme family protein [Streptomyces sp. DSM 41886]